MDGNTVIGSDESFISFAFAVSSIVLIITYIPWGIGMIREMIVYYKASKRDRAEMTNPVDEIVSSLTCIPITAYTIAKSPAMLVQGARICMQEKIFFFRCLMPKFLRFVVRPRILVAIIWVALLSSVMYTTLTFDAYAILGIPPSASTTEIKKAYRQLSKRYHPDRNTTEGARDVYFQVRRAYKSLIDRDAYAEETRSNSHEVTFGVALPCFLTSREHDGLVLFGLLGVMFIVPLFLYFRFFVEDQKLPRLLWHVRFDKERVETFLKLFGVPEDPKYVVKRDSQRAIRNVLQQLRIVPPNTREDFFAKFPPFGDFVSRCLEGDKHRAFLEGLGLTPDAIEVLRANMATSGVALVEQFDAAHASLVEKTEMELISPAAFRATRYLFQQHTLQVDAALAELTESMGGELTSARRLLNLHAEIYDLLNTVYEKSGTSKPPRQIVAKLIDMPKRVSEAVDSIEPEMEVVFRRIQKNYQKKIVELQRNQARAMLQQEKRN